MIVFDRVRSGISHRVLALRRLRSLAKLDSPSLTGVPPNQLFLGLSDDDWFWLNTEGYRRSAAARRILPSMPDPMLQVGYVGSDGATALNEGFAAYLLFKRLFEQHSGSLSASRTILDFGCGWGRILRFFLRDVDPNGLHGIDCQAEAIEACRRTNRWCRFALVDPMPPTSLPQNTFDLIFGYSVFSHLSELAHESWLIEFHRILKPGGLLIATTWPRSFIEGWEDLNSNWPEWMRYSKPIFPNREKWLAAYDRGEYCHSPQDGGGALEISFFGETCIPKGYVNAHWAQRFVILDFIEDRQQCAQNVIVVRK